MGGDCRVGQLAIGDIEAGEEANSVAPEHVLCKAWPRSV